MGLMNRLFRLIFILAILMASVHVVSCSDKPEKLVVPADTEKAEEEETSSPIGIAQQLQDVKFSQSKGDKRLWKLEAKAVEQVVDGPISLENIEITYYSDDGRVIVVTADTGLYSDAERNARLEGNVKVRTSDGGRVDTSAIQWDQETEVLTGDGDVTISKGNSTLTGTGFELRPSVESFKIYQVGGILHRGDAKL
jgi:LPS export ABC transporter protein LptC